MPVGKRPAFEANAQSMMFPSIGYNPLVAQERGAVMIEAQKKFIKNMWGAPDSVIQSINDVSYLQSTDLTSLYKDRIVPVSSNFVTAQMLNGEAGFLSSVVSPMFPTPEMNFQVKSREMNQITFSRTAAGGIPNELTYTETSWTDKVERVQLNTKIGMEVALDPIFGEDEWLFHLAGLASTAMLTIHKAIAYALVSIGYHNMIEDRARDIPYDLSKLLQAESSAFGLAALDQSRFERLIRSYERKILGLNMLILPQGGSQYISELIGESSSMIAQKVVQDSETEKWEIEMIEGPKTVKTLQYGQRRIQCVELNDFAVNMQDDRREQPLETVVTLGQFIPVDPDVRPDDCNHIGKCEVLDPIVFFQTKNQGDEMKIKWIEAIKAAHFYDKDGYPSDKAHAFAQEMTKIVKTHPEKIPIDWIDPQNDDIDVEREDFDNNSPALEMISHPTLLEMHGWRDQFPLIVYLPKLNEYRVATRMGDLHKRALPNEQVEKCARTIAKTMAGGEQGVTHYDSMVNKYLSLCKDIASTSWTNAYLEALIDANLHRIRGKLVVDGDRELYFEKTPDERLKNYPTAARLEEWKPNEFGALDIPLRQGNIRMSYPPGFDFGGGILTLAKEATDENSEWREAGARAKEVVDFFTNFHTDVVNFIGHNDNIDESLTPPWIHKNHPVASLLDSIRPLGVPVFLAVPDTHSSRVSDESSEVRSRGREFIVFNDNNILKNTVDETKRTIQSYNDTNTPFIVSNLTRFMSSLNDPVYREVNATRNLFSNKTFAGLGKELIDIGLSIGKYGDPTKDDVTGDNVVIISLIAHEFIKKYKEGKSNDESVSLLTAFMKELNSKQAIKKALIERLKTENPNILGNKNNFSAQLISLEKNSKTFVSNTESRFTFQQLIEKREERERLLLIPENDRTPEQTARIDQLTEELTIEVPFREETTTSGKIGGNYTKGPITYKRAPLMASNKLLEYLETADPILAVPADPATFYQTWIDITRGIPEKLKDLSKMSYLRNDKNGLAALPFNLKIEANLASLSSSSEMEGGRFGMNLNTNPLISKKSKSPFLSDFMSGKTSLGAGGKDSYPSDADVNVNREAMKRFRKIEDIDGTQIPAEFTDEFIGPWKSRLEYANQIGSPIVRYLFKSILLAKNSIHIHEKLAKTGQKLINVMMVRLFIQHIVSSCIVMEAGSNTIMTPIGHAHVMVTKEERGIFNINCGFFHGIIRRNPKNIGLVPYCIPHSFLGGMKIDFMKNPANWGAPNPDKPSIISIITPVSEFIYEAPIHMLNMPTYIRPDIDNAPYLRKWSGADYFEFIFGRNAVHSVENAHKHERKEYGKFVYASLTAHRSPVGYIDSITGRFKKIEGTGPRGDIRMNINGAHKTWNGEAIKFPGKGDDKILNDRFSY